MRVDNPADERPLAPSPLLGRVQTGSANAGHGLPSGHRRLGIRGFGHGIPPGRGGSARLCTRARQAVSAGFLPPESPRRSRNFWDPSEGLYGCSACGSFSGLGALVLHGLGEARLILCKLFMLSLQGRPGVHPDAEAEAGRVWPIKHVDVISTSHYDRVEASSWVALPRPLSRRRRPYNQTHARGYFATRPLSNEADWQCRTSR